MSPTIIAGVLTANVLSLGRELETIEKAGIKILHFDVMDGCFCPMLTFGPPFIKGCKTAMLKDVHLVVRDPLEKLEQYAAAGADMITVHIEACLHPYRAMQVIRQLKNVNEEGRGLLAGIALNPGTPVEAVQPLLAEADMVTLLAVNPGYSGQKFIGTTGDRMATLLEMIRASRRDILVGLDGGITKDNIDRVVRMGADIITAGSAIFDGKDAEGNARLFLDAVAAARKT